VGSEMCIRDRLYPTKLSSPGHSSWPNRDCNTYTLD